MPNWCECDLLVEGKPEELERFRQFARGRDFEVLSADRFLPYPEEFRVLDAQHQALEKKASAGEIPWDLVRRFKDGFNSGGYEWCLKHWGTKWGICHSRLVEDNTGSGSLFYQFETAWTPPLPVIRRMGELFPRLRFKLEYYEGGMGFRGTFVVEGGEVVFDEVEDYHGLRGG